MTRTGNCPENPDRYNALVPEGAHAPPHEVAFADELMEDLDLEKVDREADVVGITAIGASMSAQKAGVEVIAV